jgi:hypothetical protein
VRNSRINKITTGLVIILSCFAYCFDADSLPKQSKNIAIGYDDGIALRYIINNNFGFDISFGVSRHYYGGYKNQFHIFTGVVYRVLEHPLVRWNARCKIGIKRSTITEHLTNFNNNIESDYTYSNNTYYLLLGPEIETPFNAGSNLKVSFSIYSEVQYSDDYIYDKEYEFPDEGPVIVNTKKKNILTYGKNNWNLSEVEIAIRYYFK